MTATANILDQGLDFEPIKERTRIAFHHRVLPPSDASKALCLESAGLTNLPGGILRKLRALAEDYSRTEASMLSALKALQCGVATHAAREGQRQEAMLGPKARLHEITLEAHALLCPLWKQIAASAWRIASDLDRDDIAQAQNMGIEIDPKCPSGPRGNGLRAWAASLKEKCETLGATAYYKPELLAAPWSL